MSKNLEHDVSVSIIGSNSDYVFFLAPSLVVPESNEILYAKLSSLVI